MKERFGVLLFFLVIIVSIVIRLWSLGEVPISPDWDEVSLGYNAYSIFHTGKDEYGKLLPIVIRSFDDYKPALYAYLSIPSVVIFGLTAFAVRLPSAIFGVLTVVALYFLVQELFRKNYISLLSSFLLAISPWHIQFSRIAFESNVGLSLNIFFALFFLKGLKKPWLLFVSSIFAGLSIYVYQSEKVFTPLLLLVLLIIYRKDFFSIPRKHIFSFFVIGIIVVIPMIAYLITDKNALGRARGVSIFSESNELLKENSRKLLVDKNNNDSLGLFLDNRRIEFTKSVISGYISHFNINWLFITGDISRHHAPNMGLMYLFELPFLFLGIYYLFFGNLDKKSKFFVFSWLLIAPIPASITSGVPHAVRVLNAVPMASVLTALGLISAYKQISMNRFKNIVLFGAAVIFLFNFFYYLNQYFVQQNYFNARDWQYGYEKIVPRVQELEQKFDKVVVSNQEPMDQSYMFFLFYLEYPPDLYQKQSSSGGFRENHQFGKYEFRPIKWDKEKKDGTILYVGRPSDFPQGTSVLYDVNYPNGEKAMVIVK